MLSDHIIKNVLKPDGCVIVATLINSQLEQCFITSPCLYNLRGDLVAAGPDFTSARERVLENDLLRHRPSVYRDTILNSH